MGIVKIAVGLLSINLLVLIHELGHYWAARFFNIKVKTFSIGLGKKLLTVQGKHCEFALSAIPIGGYCKFYGEQNMIQAWEKKMDYIPKEEGTLYSLSPWKRIIISLAGPLANALFSLLLLFPFAWSPQDNYTLGSTIVIASRYQEDPLAEPYPSELYGLQTGDTILSCNGTAIASYEELEAVIQSYPNRVISMQIQRDDSLLELMVTPRLNDETGMGFLGIVPFLSTRLSNDFKYKDIHIPKGSVLLSCQERELVSLTDLVFYQWDSSHVSLSYLDPRANEIEVSIPTEAFSFNHLPIEYTIITSDAPSFSQGWTQSLDLYFEYWALTFKGFGQLFAGGNVRGQLMGPLRTPWLAGETSVFAFRFGVRQGLQTIISFLVPLGIGLAFLNLLPIPVLDGGQIILFLIDWMKRSSLKPQFIFRYQLIGSMVVLMLMALAISMDVMYFFRSRL